MNYIPPFEITSKIIDLIAKIAEILGKLEILAPSTITPKLRRGNRIKTITGTLEIEGNSLGIKKITSIINGKRVLGDLREIAEVNGAIKVYENIDSFDYQNLDDLLLAHKMLMGEILSNAGSFRLKNVGVGSGDNIIHIAPPYNRVPNLMKDLFRWLKDSDIHPLIKSSVFHYEFEFIHPFIDGNGRMGRFWQSLMLYNWKKIFSTVPIESIIRDNQEKYYHILKISGQQATGTPFIEFMLEAIYKACLNEIKSQENDPKDDTKDDTKNKDRNLNPKERSTQIIKLMIKNPKITILELSKILKVSDATIKRDLAKLKREKFIHREGSLTDGLWVVDRDLGRIK